MQCGAVQCSAVQIPLQCSAVQCSADTAVCTRNSVVPVAQQTCPAARTSCFGVSWTVCPDLVEKYLYLCQPEYCIYHLNNQILVYFGNILTYNIKTKNGCNSLTSWQSRGARLWHQPPAPFSLSVSDSVCLGWHL